MIHDLAVAFAFLTRIPIHHRDGIDFRRIVRWFPLVGLAVGAASASMYWLAALRLPALPSAALALLVSVLITGGFHADGLADICDGLVGGWTPEDRLRILKDSRHGTYGVLAIVLQIVLQVALLSAFDAMDAMAAIVVAHSLARFAPVLLMLAPAAPGQEGMGASYARRIRPFDIVAAGLVTVCCTLPFVGIALIPLGAATLASTWVVWSYVRRRIGGIVGDALGAAEQVAETVILLTYLVLVGSPYA